LVLTAVDYPEAGEMAARAALTRRVRVLLEPPTAKPPTAGDVEQRR
jgi:hypothetical protein